MAHRWQSLLASLVAVCSFSFTTAVAQAQTTAATDPPLVVEVQVNEGTHEAGEAAHYLTEEEHLLAAEIEAAPGARRVLSTARQLIDGEVVIRGSCYTWLNAVYTRAGGRKHNVFNGNRRNRFADTSLLQPGDWVFFVNHDYGDVGHSAIFVAWLDADRKDALMVSYPGERRQVPGRYSSYVLDNVYRIDRMSDPATTVAAR